MFRQLGKLFRMMGYLFSSMLGKKTDALAKNPEIMKARYEEIIHERRGRINQYKDAIARLKAEEVEKIELLRRLNEEVVKLEKLKSGAIEATRKVLEKHGGNLEAAKKDADYVKWHSMFRDFSNTLTEKLDRIKQVEADVERYGTQLGSHKASIQSMQRELKKLRSEQREAVADVISAKEEAEIADMFSGISEDRSAIELQELRDQRNTARANASVSREMAGLDRQNDEDELLAYATQTESDDEFEALLGIHAKSSVDEPIVPLQEKLPE